MPLEKSRIITFAGRFHHVQRLDGIMQALGRAGANAVYLTADNYLNIDPNTVHLIQSGKSFIHCLDYLPSGSSGNVLSWASQILSGVSGEWKSDVRSYVDPFYFSSSAYEFCETLLAFDQVLEREKPNLVMILHGANAWGGLLAYLCSLRKIPCLAFQEGMLRLLDQQTQGKQSLAAEYVSHLCVWSESAFSAYVESGVSSEKLYITGIPHLDPWLTKIDKVATRIKLGLPAGGRLIALCPPLVSRYEGDLGKAISQLSDWAFKNRVTLAIRFHPFDSQDHAYRVIQATVGNPYVKVVNVETLDLIAVSDLVISQHSTVAVEALALGVPLVELDLDSVGVLESLALQGVATLVTDMKQLDTFKPVSANLREWQEKNLGPLDGKSVERVVNVIAGLV